MAENGIPGRKLTPAQRRCINALLVERDNRSAALSARVGERTLYKWLHDETFLYELQRAQTELLNAHMRRLTSLMGKALDTLDTLMDKAGKDSVKESAANHIAQRLINWHELISLEARVAALESRSNGTQH